MDQLFNPAQSQREMIILRLSALQNQTSPGCFVKLEKNNEASSSLLKCPCCGNDVVVTVSYPEI